MLDDDEKDQQLLPTLGGAQQLGASALFRRSSMTVLLITALRAAETLAAFHWQRAKEEILDEIKRGA